MHENLRFLRASPMHARIGYWLLAIGHFRLWPSCAVCLPTSLRARSLWLKSPAANFLSLLVLAAAWSAPAAETATPNRILSPADRQLLQAVHQGNLPLLQTAIAAGANANCPGTNALPPLLELLRSATAPLDTEHRQCVACLFQHGAAVDPMDSNRRTPLIHAARLGDLDTVRLLVEAEACVTARDRFHKSALFYAVEANRRDIVLYLAANGDLLSPTVKERKARP
jgi:hypothetical protein